MFRQTSRWWDPADSSTAVPKLASLSPTLAESWQRLIAVGRTRCRCSSRGETGTGKELVARAVHALSGARGPLVAVNCGALPPNLVESELFGYKKGAFSGATEDRPGLIRAADGGTLFLDEVGELPARGAGGAPARAAGARGAAGRRARAPVPVDLRVVAATHRDLDVAGRGAEFRADLFARLAGFVVRCRRCASGARTWAC